MAAWPKCHAWHGSFGSELRLACLALDDLAEVAQREDDAPAVQVEGDLLAVGARLERTLGHLGEAEIAEDLGCARR